MGVTSIVDAKTGRGALMAYRRLEDEGKLDMRVQASLSKHDYAVTVIGNEDATRLINERKTLQSRLVNTNSVKIVADGTFPSFTSLLLEPYSNNPGTFKEFVDAGVKTAYATDWPLMYPSPAPWPFLEAMVTRKDPYGKVGGQMGDPVTLAQAIRVFTLGGAQAVMQEKENGSIEEGKHADMIVLDRDLFTIPVSDIDQTKVLRTVFGGRTVYQSP